MSHEGRYPDFLCVGAHKAGTSALQKWLSIHPEIFVPSRKELYFWHIVDNPNKASWAYFDGLPKTVREHLDHFRDASPDQVVGEVNPHYLYYHQ